MLSGTSFAAEKYEIAVVAKVTGIPWFNRMETGVNEAAKKLDVNAYQTGPSTPDPAQQVKVIEDLIAKGVEVRTEGELLKIPGTKKAKPEDFGHEFLDMIIAAKLVDGVDQAIAHIRRYGSQHTESILTENDATAQCFFEQLDSAILMRNASTQFADGGEFGMGAEIGIATGKLHARGPVGAEQLCSFKYLVTGDGTIRP